MGMDLYINEVQTIANTSIVLTAENYVACSVDYDNMYGDFSKVALSRNQLIAMQPDLNIFKFYKSFFEISCLKHTRTEYLNGRHEPTERYYPVELRMLEKYFDFYVTRSWRKTNRPFYYDFLLVENLERPNGGRDFIALVKIDKIDGSIEVVSQCQLNKTGYDLHRLLGASRIHVYEIANEVAYVRKPFRMSGGHNYEGNPHYKTVEYLLNKYSQECGSLYLTIADMAAFKEIEPLMSETTRELDLWSRMTDKTIMEINW